MTDDGFNLLDMLGELHDTAIEYSGYMKECNTEEHTIMLKDLINRVVELNDFVFENIDLDKF